MEIHNAYETVIPREDLSLSSQAHVCALCMTTV